MHEAAARINTNKYHAACTQEHSFAEVHTFIFKILVSHSNFPLKHTNKNTHSSLLQTFNKTTLLNKDPTGADKEIYILYAFQNWEAHRIYCFLKQRSRKHKLRETFMASHASWRRHSAFDPRTVKTTAGIYKGGEKRCLTFPGGNWQMEEVYCSNIPNSSACYFYCFLSTTTWFNANSNYSCISVISRSEIQPAAYKYPDVFPHISVPAHSAPTLWYSQHIICCCAIFSVITTSHLRAFTHTLHSWNDRKAVTLSCSRSRTEGKLD